MAHEIPFEIESDQMLGEFNEISYPRQDELDLFQAP